jgi:hypothetical protein
MGGPRLRDANAQSTAAGGTPRQSLSPPHHTDLVDKEGKRYAPK